MRNMLSRRQLQGFVRHRGGLSHSAFFILLAFAFPAKFATSGALLRPRLYPELQFFIPELLLLRLKHKRRTAIFASQWHIEIRQVGRIIAELLNHRISFNGSARFQAVSTGPLQLSIRSFFDRPAFIWIPPGAEVCFQQSIF